jgi:Na+-transporting methylmalonyl-CoA/oxaloacetate decarboxylase gamma subunit
MPPSPDRHSVSLLGQSALSRVIGMALVIALLWLAIHWAVILP